MPRSLVDEEIALRTRDERDEPDEPDELVAKYWLGVDMRPCLFDCDRFTDRPDGICSDHDLEPGGPLWGRALTAEQVREEMTRVRWNVR